MENARNPFDAFGQSLLCNEIPFVRIKNVLWWCIQLYMGNRFCISPTEILEKWNFHHLKILMIFVLGKELSLTGLSSLPWQYKVINQRKKKSYCRTDLSSILSWEHPAFLLGNVLLFPKWNMVLFLWLLTWRAARVHSFQRFGFSSLVASSLIRLHSALLMK